MDGRGTARRRDFENLLVLLALGRLAMKVVQNGRLSGKLV